MSQIINLIPEYSEREFQQRFCSKCNAHCCRKGVFIPLLKEELGKMNKLARQLQRDVVLSIETINDEPVWVMSHSDYPCGFLDQKTNRCLIYLERPSLCREHFCEPRSQLGIAAPHY